jgi:ClpP class serine protease
LKKETLLSTYHKLNRLLSEKVYNQPLLITQDSLNTVLDYLEYRESSVTAREIEASLIENNIERSEKMLTDDLAIIPITGSLTYSSNFLSALCGLTSYESLDYDVTEALEMGIKNIVFRADSGGGEAFAMMSTADMIRQKADKYGAKIYTYIDGMAASACYGLIAISDEIIAHPDSQAGSIGVVIQLMNNSEKLKKDGYKRKFITSADSKVPFDEEGEFKTEWLADLKESVDELHTKFITHVAKYRPMSTSQVNDLQAKVFGATKSMQIGLIDKIMDHAEFQIYLENLANDEDMSLLSRLNFSPKKNTKASADVSQEVVEATVEQQEAALAALPEENVDMAEQALIQELQAKMDALQTQYDADVAEALAALDEKDAELNAALKELDSIKAAQAQEALDAKKAKLVAVVGTEMAQDLFADLSALPDAAFDKVVASYQSANAKFEKSELANEVGYEADGSADADQKESALARRLKAKQAKQQ